MSDKSGIEWTDATWGPVVGCSKISDGCTNCYAETWDRRIRGKDGEPFAPWTARNAAYNVRLHPERLSMPLRWTRPRMIFVNSLSDLFHEQVPDSFIAECYAIMALAPRHIFQILTKRPARAQKLLSDPRFLAHIEHVIDEWYLDSRSARPGPLPKLQLPLHFPLRNVWQGTSVENQRTVDERVHVLAATPGAVRFLSAEPLLEQITILRSESAETRAAMAWLSWIIIGGESGPGARPCHVPWIRALLGECREGQVAPYVKQLGAYPTVLTSEPGEWADKWGWVLAPNGPGGEVRWRVRLRDRKGGDPAQWSTDLNVREFPNV